MILLNGKQLATQIKEELKQKIEQLKENHTFPCLAVILVGDNPASRAYVNMKKKDCDELGIRSLEYKLEQTTTEGELMDLIVKLNRDSDVHGILLQLPLPSHLNEKIFLEAISPKKDVDCFHPMNVGYLATGTPVFAPCTPAGIIRLVKENGFTFQGKECVIVNRSNIVGKPLANLILMENGTVTIAHSKTHDLKGVCKRADILVAAVGRMEMFDASYVKEGAVVIDVGVNRDANGKIVGDVKFDEVSKIASAVTPCVGGVGPMTRAILMENTVKAAQL